MLLKLSHAVSSSARPSEGTPETEHHLVMLHVLTQNLKKLTYILLTITTTTTTKSLIPNKLR
jgi:hypothetical protein